MPKNWTADSALVDSVAENLCEAVVLLPKQLLQIDALMRRFEMPFSHIQILVMLASGDKSISDISTTLGIAKPNITPLLDRLCSRKLVSRVRSSEDKRIVNVHLTPAGEAMLNKLRAAVVEQVTAWDDRFNRSEVKQLNNALAFLLQIAQPKTTEPRS